MEASRSLVVECRSFVAEVARRPVTRSYRLAVGVAWLGFVWASTHWYSWQRTIDLLFGSDVPEYERVARAAPGLPTEALPSQHADRFVPHYLVGLASDALHVGDRPLYYVFAFVLLAALVVLVDRIVEPLGLGRLEYALSIGALVANPYVFRFLAIAPGRLADSVFMLGGGLALLGLLRTRAWLLVGGLVVATLGRSEAVFPLVALAPIGVALSPEWRRRSLRRRRTAAFAAFAVPLAVYGLVRLADHSFSYRDHPGLFGLTILGSLESLPGSGGRLGLHFARTFVGIAGATAVIAGALAARRMGRYGALPFAFWAALAAGIAVSGEAILLNPAWINGSEPLLAALGVAFLAVAAAVALSSLGGATIRLAPAAAAVAGLVLTSLNHRYAAISPVSTPAAFAALASVGAAITAVAVAVGARR